MIPQDQNDAFIIGDFQDDYNYQYHITNDKWLLQPELLYQFTKWDKENNYIIASSRDKTSGKKKYTRIDYVLLEDMVPYTWCYCISNYEKESPDEAESIINIDSNDLKKGCNGFPFSRMKKVD